MSLTLGGLVAARRHVLELTQEQLAAIVGVTDSYISRIETNRQVPATGVLKGLETALNLERGALLDLVPVR